MNSQKIVICGEVYSPNLGDAVIAESLSYLIQQLSPFTPHLLDFSSRQPNQQKLLHEVSFGMAVHQKRRIERLFWRMVLAICSRERAMLIWWFFKWRKQRYHFYQQELDQAVALVFGGGNILADNQFNFPLKIYGVAECAQKMRIPVLYYGCGVNLKWSSIATRLFRQAFQQTSYLSLRDNESLQRITQRAPNLPCKPSVVWDVAINCAEAYGIDRCSKARMIGLGICSAAVLSRHTPAQADFFQNELISFWVNIAEALTAKSIPFQLFTNGAKEDEQFAAQVIERMVAQGLPVPPLVCPKTALELVQDISQFRAVIAFRLHACIIAHSLGIPTVGLKWDTKVESFFNKCKRDRYCISAEKLTADQVVDLMNDAILNYDVSALETIKAESRQEIQQLISAIAVDGKNE
ncbi:polysaccharide pyruvyl transferase family protein [Leptolyngbya ohadii]|uniref:polysaccharide pyruvyl transferase family protein n=1 Tax=Leptolyngbya ohadii TaxID=1962290 RepID=UPI0015C5ABBB|nr:polysaccharide pyruvyl transferase family protein [Leptolyngbya ohadii]